MGKLILDIENNSWIGEVQSNKQKTILNRIPDKMSYIRKNDEIYTS